MRIAILTLPLHTNYGGILQAYALQTVLIRMGHDVVVLDKELYHKELPFYKKPFVYSKRLVEKYFLKKITTIYLEKHFNEMKRTIIKNVYPFIKENIYRYEIDNLNRLKNFDFDAIIVGSDQVWRPLYFTIHFKKIELAFLSFAEKWNIKRIAYAPSFGVDKWEYTEKQTKVCGNLLKKFNSISVREISGIKLCKEKFNLDAQLVLDPTFLLSKDDYIDIFKRSNTPKSSGDLMIYLLDKLDFADILIKKISSKNNLIPFITNNEKVDCGDVPIENRIQSPVECWIRGFYDSKLIITDSFHACVFSIIFNKPFIVIRNKRRGNTRIDSLLKMFNQEYRVAYDLSIINKTDILFKEPCAEKDVIKMKQQSLDFLIRSLNK